MTLTVGRFVTDSTPWPMTPPRTLHDAFAICAARASDIIPADIRNAPGFVYIGTPYTRYPGGTKRAARLAAQAAGRLMDEGLRVFSPIAHSHYVAKHGDVDPLDADFWKEQDAPFVRAAGSIVVVQMRGWKESSGLTHEIEEFTKAGKPIWYVAPEALGVVE